MARPSDVRQRRMRVSPQWAVRRVEGEEGCQKGVGVGVEMRATEQVEPPLKGAFVAVSEGEERSSEALSGRSASTASSAERERRSWVDRKERSAAKKACVRIVSMLGVCEDGGEKAGGWKRRKYPPTVSRHDFIRAD